MRTLVAGAMVALLGLAGCSGEDPFDTGPTRSAAPEALGISTDTVESAGKPVANKEAEPAPKTERVKAKAGVTGRGDYGGGFGTTALSTRVRVEEKLEFLQVDQALTLYKATNGHLPKTEEEFWKDVVEANKIPLPKLREGDNYKYDVEKGQLMVDKLVEQ